MEDRKKALICFIIATVGFTLCVAANLFLLYSHAKAEPPDPRANKELADWIEVQQKRVQLYVVNNGKTPLECEGWVFGKTKTGDNLAKKRVFKVAPDGVAKGFAVYLPHHAPNYFTGGAYYVECK